MTIPTGPAAEGATHPGYVVVAGRWVRASLTGGGGSGPSADALATLTDRVSVLEAEPPTDLSGVTGRLDALESADPDLGDLPGRVADLEARPDDGTLPPRPAPDGTARTGPDGEISNAYAALMNDAPPTAEDAANRRWIRVTNLPADAEGRTDEWWLARATTSGLTWEQEGAFATGAPPVDQYARVHSPVGAYTTRLEDFGAYLRVTTDVTVSEPPSGFTGRRIDVANVGGARVNVVPATGVTFEGPASIDPGHAVSLVVTGPASYDVRGGAA